jgi:hypothetical protein
VDTLGHLLALLVTPDNEQERAQVEELAKVVQMVTGEHVELAYVDQSFMFLPRRWVVERGFACLLLHSFTALPLSP